MSWLNPASWYALWEVTRWQGPRKLTSGAADEWFFSTLEAKTANTPMNAFALYRWDGASWKRVR